MRRCWNYDWEIFFPIYENELMEYEDNPLKEKILIAGIGDEWVDSPKEKKKLKK